MIRSVCIGLLAFGLLACRSKQEQQSHSSAMDQASNDTLFYQHRGACFGTCPVFDFVIYKDGRALLNGIRHVKHVGSYQAMLAHEQYAPLMETIQKIGFLDWDDRYDNDKVTDLPSIITFVDLNGNRKQVLARYKAPESLNLLNEKVDQLIDQVNWTKMSTNE